MDEINKRFLIKIISLVVWGVLSISFLLWDISMYGQYHNPNIFEWLALIIIFGGCIPFPFFVEYYIMDRKEIK